MPFANLFLCKKSRLGVLFCGCQPTKKQARALPLRWRKGAFYRCGPISSPKARQRWGRIVLSKPANCRVRLGGCYFLFMLRFSYGCLLFDSWAGWIEHLQEVMPTQLVLHYAGLVLPPPPRSRSPPTPTPSRQTTSLLSLQKGTTFGLEEHLEVVGIDSARRTSQIGRCQNLAIDHVC